MRVLASVFLLAALLLNTFGFYLSFFAEQHSVHEQVGRSMDTHPATEHSITLNHAQFRRITWLREGKECRINGNLYDVAKIEFLAGGVKLYVEEDMVEAVLINGFIKTLLGQDKEQSKVPMKVLPQNLFTDFVVTESNFAFFNAEQAVRMFNVMERFSSRTPEEQTPPPPNRA
jgi:hypothetical protein